MLTVTNDLKDDHTAKDSRGEIMQEETYIEHLQK